LNKRAGKSEAAAKKMTVVGAISRKANVIARTVNEMGHAVGLLRRGRLDKSEAGRDR